jgi:hypothetical protein
MCSCILIRQKITKYTQERNGVKMTMSKQQLLKKFITCLSVFILYLRAKSLNHKLLQLVKVNERNVSYNHCNALLPVEEIKRLGIFGKVGFH